MDTMTLVASIGWIVLALFLYVVTIRLYQRVRELEAALRQARADLISCSELDGPAARREEIARAQNTIAAALGEKEPK